jgi:Na+/H+ antiporter NhaD/arsenite permease-like protein
MFLNDTVCLMLTLPVLAIVRHSRLRATPYLIALAMSANIGSVMTVVGNPQNMLIAGYSDWTYARFLLWMAPSGIVGTAILVGVLAWLYRGELQLTTTHDLPPDGRPSITPQVDRVLLAKSLLVLGGVLVAFVLVGDLSLVALVGAVTLLIISRRPTAEVLARVDWVLLAFFAGLFVVVRGLEQTGVVKDVAETLQSLYGKTLATQIPVFTTATVIGSNLVSNVPLVVLAKSIVPQLIEPKLMWLVLAMASTLAGNLTIPGSVATLIVLETAKRAPSGRATVGFFDFLRVGIPVTLLTTTAGALLLAIEHVIFAK